MNKRELQAQKTYQKLLTTSKNMIVEKGYNNVSISQICSKCKVAKGTFYTYFSSKRDIVVEILLDINKSIFSTKWDKSLSTVDRMMEYIDCYLDSINKQGSDFTRVFLKIIMDEKLDINAVEADKHQIVAAEIINAGKEKGEVRTDIDTASLCRYLQGFIYGIMIDWCDADGGYDIINYGHRALLDFLDILKPRRN